ncbi:MAG: hypothetical protein ABIK62_01240, partial [candidate division WOR-3 bacterium]
LAICLASMVRAQSLSSVSVAFERFVVRKAAAELVRGHVFFAQPDLLLLRADSSAFTDGSVRSDDSTALNDLRRMLKPVNQWMRFQDTALLIYYPDEARAFEIHARHPLLLPFFQAFVGVVKEDFGLPQAGFTLSRTENRGETLVVHWLPSKALTRYLRSVSVCLTADRLAAVESRDTKGGVVSRAEYGDHVEWHGTWFPQRITLVQHQGCETTFEQVSYSDPQFGIELPDSVTRFSLPIGVECQRVTW